MVLDLLTCLNPLVAQEYNVRAQTINKQHFVGRFLQGLPAFSKKKASGTRWSLQREGLQGRQLTEALRVLTITTSCIFFIAFPLNPNVATQVLLNVDLWH